MKIEIYQVRNDISEKHDISFMNYAYVTKEIQVHGHTIKRNLKQYYEKKYEFEKDYSNHTNEEILDELFYTFNMERPDDFKGHSMSTSAMVVFDDEKMYFCDSYGWVEVE